MSCALRVNTSTKSTSITFGEGQQNGAGDASPLRLLLQGRCAVCLFVVLCGKPRHRLMRGQRATPTPPVLCGRGFATTAPCFFCGVVATRCCGGRFPASAPRPPGGQVRQKHARTRSCFHPRPVQPRVHAGSAAVCVLSCPLDRAEAGGGNTQAVGCAGCLFEVARAAPLHCINCAAKGKIQSKPKPVYREKTACLRACA